MYVNQNKGFRKISQELNEAGYRSKNNKLFSHNSIADIISNSKYYGNLTRNKMARSKITHDTKVSTRPQEEWIIVKYGDKLPNGSIFDSIPPIVDEATFNAVQERIKSRVSPKNGQYRGTSILSSKIKCGLCGANYVINTWSAKGITHKFYVCNNKRLNTKAVCNNSNVQLEKLEAVLNSDWINSIILRNKLLIANSITTQIKVLEEQLSKYSQQDIQSLTSAVIRLESKKKTLIDYMLDGTINKEALAQDIQTTLGMNNVEALKAEKFDFLSFIF